MVEKEFKGEKEVKEVNKIAVGVGAVAATILGYALYKNKVGTKINICEGVSQIVKPKSDAFIASDVSVKDARQTVNDIIETLIYPLDPEEKIDIMIEFPVH